MRTCRRCMLPSDATPARDTPHAHARALWHVLTKYPWQDCADEDGEADDRHQHVLHQHFHHPGAERLQTFLNNVQVEITVTFFESFKDGNMNVENIGSSSRHQHNSAQHSFSAVFSHTQHASILQLSAAACAGAAGLAVRTSRAIVGACSARTRSARLLVLSLVVVMC